jgi:hypothetical protein
MEWYLPMTIIPGIGLLILSTSNIMLELNSEINELEMEAELKFKTIKSKLAQLKRLSIAIVFLYIGVLFFLVAGVLKSFDDEAFGLFTGLLLTGVSSVIISISFLLVHSIKGIQIRQKHLRI